MFKIRHKIAIAILSVALITSFLVGSISLYQNRKIITHEAHQRLLETAASLGKELEFEMSKRLQMANAIQGVLENTFDFESAIGNDAKMQSYKQKYSDLYLSIAKKSKLLSLWIVFSPEAAPNGKTISIWDGDRDGNFVQEKDYKISDMDLSANNMKWWTDAKKNGDTWTKPYYWENWDLELISYSRAIFYDSTHIACIGSDFDFSSFRKKYENLLIYKSGYVILFDDKLNFIIHPKLKGKNLKSVYTEQQLNEFTDITANQKRGLIHYKFEGKRKVQAFYKLPNGWIISIAPPEEEIYEGFTKIRLVIIYLLISCILISIIIAYTLGGSISLPINKLIDKLHEGGTKGTLSDLKGIKSNAEVKELIDHFNLFVTSQNQMLAQLKEAEAILIKAKEKAEESDRLKTSFLSNVSHEIRTPLNAITGFSQLLKMDDRKPQEKQYVNIILDSSKNLLRIVNDIIEFSKIETDRIRLQYDSFHLNNFLVNLKLAYQGKKLNPNNLEVILKTELSDEGSKIISDKVRLRQILQNLLDNAAKFTHEGFIEFGYTKKDEKTLQFYVRDTGIGVPEKHAKLIFEKFRQIDDSDIRKYEGMGLGLPIVFHLIRLFDGEIWFENAEPGTIFYFEIPYEKSITSNIK